LLTEKKHHTTTISDHNRSIPVSYELPLDILDHNRSIPVSYELPLDILDLNRSIPVSYGLPFDLRQNSKSSDLLREPYFETLRFFTPESPVTQIPFFSFLSHLWLRHSFFSKTLADQRPTNPLSESSVSTISPLYTLNVRILRALEFFTPSNPSHIPFPAYTTLGRASLLF
jgi:hypothetical protein